MFTINPQDSQQMFEQMGMEPQMNEIQGNDGEAIRYYVYDLKE